MSAGHTPGPQGCKIPPKGWWCSREAGHEGPCAARSVAPVLFGQEWLDRKIAADPDAEVEARGASGPPTCDCGDSAIIGNECKGCGARFGAITEPSKAAHTPGPWLAASHPSSKVGLPVVGQPSGRSIASVTFFHLGDAFANHDRESQANARLIAAAPEMLEALERCQNFIANTEGEIGDTLECGELARAAIAKARGEA